MADGYNIKIGVDARSGEQGVKSFTGSVNDALKALRDFDKKAGSAFKALDQFTKFNGSGLNRALSQVAAGVERLNKVKINTRLVNNLQTLARALNGIKFNGGESLRALPAALKELEKIKVNAKLVTDLTALKAALKGFNSPSNTIKAWPKALSGFSNIQINASLAKTLEGLKVSLKGFTGPPKSLSNWPRTLNALGAVSISPNLPKTLAALKLAMAGFTGPSKSALNLPKFIQQLSTAKVSSALAKQVEALKLAMAGFAGPSAKSANNLQKLITAMGSANVGQVQKVAAALAKLNGLSLNVGRTLGNMGSGGSRSMGIFTKTIESTNRAMQQLTNMSHGVKSLVSLVQGAIGGLSIAGFAKSVYDTGASWQALTRTLAAVSASSDEVQQQLKFIQDLTTRMPISIDAAAESYRKFAAAARLSGTSVDDTQKIFSGFATGFSAMGLSVENQKYAFTALEQMISKGKISSEELKQQLGEHLPGAVQIFADAMGVTTSKLLKMMEQGQVTSDVIIKASERVATQFGGASQTATEQTSGQLNALSNAWTNFKRKIFDSGFDAALGAMAGKFASILDSGQMQKFATDIGAAFKRAFQAVSLFGNYLVQNKDAVLSFIKAFAGYSALVAFYGALKLLSAPLMILGSISGIAATGLRLIGAALTALGAGGIVSSVKTIATAVFGLTTKFMLLAAATLAAAGAADYLFNDGKIGTALKDSVVDIFKTIGASVATMGAQMGDSMGGVFAKADANSEDFLNRVKAIEEANRKAGEVSTDQSKRMADADAKRLADLTTEQQALWDKVTAVGAANEAYNKQMQLVEEIAKKKNLSPEMTEGFRRVMYAQKDDKINPIDVSKTKMADELGSIKSLTAEQKALNAAKQWENDMLNKNVVATAEQWNVAKKAVQDYQMAIAKMNGEAGNGLERFTAKVGDFMDGFHNTVASGIEDLSSTLADALTGGGADFASMARGIARNFAKIAIDGLIKDAAGAMGMDGTKNGQDAANKALGDLGAVGKTIQAQQVDLYASSVTIATPGDTGLRGSLGLEGASNQILKSQMNNTDLRPSMDSRGQTGTLNLDKVNMPSPITLDKSAIDFKEMQDALEAHRLGMPVPADMQKYLTPTADTADYFKTSELGGKNRGMTQGLLQQRLMKDFDLKDFQAAGVVGNLAHESAGFTANNEIGKGGGFGLAQWTGDRRKLFEKYAADNKLDPELFGTQYGYLKHELKNTPEKKAIEALRGTTNENEATSSFMNTFERPGTPHLDSRLNYAAETMKNGNSASAAIDSNFGSGMGVPPVSGGANVQYMGGLNWNGKQMQDVKGLTFHHTGGRGSPQSVVDTLNQRGLGAQYIMDRDGTISQTVPDGAQVSHMRNAQNGSGLSNANALGIEMIAKDNNDLTDAQKMSGLKFIQDMKTKYPGIGDNVYGHGELNAHKQESEGMGVVNLYREQQKQLAQQPDMMPTGSIPKIDPAAAASVTQLNSSLQQTANNAQMAAMPMQSMNSAVQQTGASAQMAATSAQTAGPAFQQAGVQIGTAGQSAQSAGAAAQSANTGVNGFTQGIGQLLGPLSSAIPGLGQFGGAIMGLLGSLGGGGGSAGLFSEGGYSTNPVSTTKIPAFSEGTANTSGGMPAILHPNEAVIPLSRGRKIPVEMGDSGNNSSSDRQESLDKQRPVMVINLNGVKDADSFKRSKGQVTSAMASAQQRAALRDG